MSESIEFIGEPFDSRQPSQSDAVTVPTSSALSTFLREIREMVTAAHASALDTQTRLQHRLVPGATP